MDSELLKQIQKLELIILQEIDRICVKHNITYCLAYGSLIGAVRHQGFIPWDDDIDLFMSYEEYEHFLKVCPDELDDKFVLHCQKTDSNYPLAMTKIRLKDTLFLEKDVQIPVLSNGIWVDIFVLENDPKKISRLQDIHFELVNCINTIKGIRLGWNSLNGCSIFTKLLYCFFRPFNINQIYKVFHYIKSINRNTKCDYFVEFSGCYGPKRQTFKKIDLFPPRRSLFAGIETYVPNNPHNILTQVYGDGYMTLPPVEKRKTHNPIKVDLGAYDKC